MRASGDMPTTVWTKAVCAEEVKRLLLSITTCVKGFKKHGQIWHCVNVLLAAHQNGCHKTHTHTSTTGELLESSTTILVNLSLTLIPFPGGEESTWQTY